MFSIPLRLGRKFAVLHARAKAPAEEKAAKIRAELREKPDDEWITLSEAAQRAGLQGGMKMLSSQLEKGIYPEFERRSGTDFQDPARDMTESQRKAAKVAIVRSKKNKFVHESIVEKIKARRELEEFLKENFYTRGEAERIFGLNFKQALDAHFDKGFPSVLVQAGSKVHNYVPKTVVGPEGSEMPLDKPAFEKWLSHLGHANHVFFEELDDPTIIPRTTAWRLHDWLKTKGLVDKQEFATHPVSGAELLKFPKFVKYRTQTIRLENYLKIKKVREDLECFLGLRKKKPRKK
ncbi:MAG: hypothetical protein QXR53_03040 [Candidatus Norongarragalinales archaeon]